MAMIRSRGAEHSLKLKAGNYIGINTVAVFPPELGVIQLKPGAHYYCPNINLNLFLFHTMVNGVHLTGINTFTAGLGVF